MKILEHLTSLQGRLTAGVALVAAIVIGLWPDHARSVDAAKAAAIGTTALAWLFAEIGGRRAPSEHDLQLFERIVSSIPQRVLDFLKDQDWAWARITIPALEHFMKLLIGTVPDLSSPIQNSIRGGSLFNVASKALQIGSHWTLFLSTTLKIGTRFTLRRAIPNCLNHLSKLGLIG